LCTRSMIAFAYGWYVVTCSWFGCYAIIVTHLLEVTFGFAPIVKDNKLRLWVTVPTSFYETNSEWMLLPYLWLQQFQSTCA
jgi:hypothetical protein